MAKPPGQYNIVNNYGEHHTAVQYRKALMAKPPGQY